MTRPARIPLPVRATCERFGAELLRAAWRRFDKQRRAAERQIETVRIVRRTA